MTRLDEPLLDDYRLDRKYTDDGGRVFLTGLQALARLPLEQLRADRRSGHRTAAFVSGYQGSPLGGYGEAVRAAAARAPDLPLIFKPGLNEEYAATAVMGAQLASTRPDARYDGVIGVWYGKAPGVDRATDALRHAVFAGAAPLGGVVAVVGDDPSAKSSTIPSSSAGVLSDMHMPVLYPGDPAEALDLGRHAIAMSRTTGLWSALKIVSDVADATATVDLDPDRVQPVIPLLDGEPYLHVPDGRLLTPRTVDVEREILDVRYELARTYAVQNRLNYAVVDPDRAWIGIVSSGITYREVREALARLGLADDSDIAAGGIRLLKMGMPVPFSPDTMRRFARGLQQVFVIEEKRPSIESLVKDALYSMPDRPAVVGKHDEAGELLVPGWGGLDADAIAPLLRRRLESHLSYRLAPEPRRPIPVSVWAPGAGQRSPFFCSGCPHNRSTQAPDGALVGAGIGCHTMTLLMDEERFGELTGLTCMGSEGAQWIGMADFVDHPHLIQNLGDGTFFHSGQLAVQAAVAAGVNITYKLLYNGTVAMTGGQDPTGGLDIPRVAEVLLAQGVKRVLVTTEDPARYAGARMPAGVEVWSRDRLMEAQRVLAEVSGVTVLIHDQACAAESRRARKRGLVETPRQRVVINQRICEGCGDCSRISNCLSVQPTETPFGRKTTIDQTTCNLDFSCLEGDCPSFMTVDRPDDPADRSGSAGPGRLRRLGLTRRAATSAAGPPQPPPAPDPQLVVPADEVAVRITGVGGTGVVTVGQIIGTAAMLDGFHTRGLDQIGLSQKAGPVVSDVRLSKAHPSFTNRLGQGQADLLLALDQLTAAGAQGMNTVSERTAVVGSTSPTPTGAMIIDPAVPLPTPEELAERIASASGPIHCWADAQAVTADLFGSTVTANLFVVGMAVQAGALPIDPACVERAIDLNGVAVESNTAAFRWGRVQVADEAAVDAARAASRPSEVAAAPVERFADRLDRLGADGELRDRLSLLAGELARWGDRSVAAGWFDVLDRVAAAERAVDPGSTRLLAAAAAGLYKLTAYKDEYEVARLMTDPEAMAEARLVAEGGKVAWKLHPPVLRAMGMDRKISVGVWAAPAVRLLARAKRLRGTRWDPFGRSEVRRTERRLPAEYIEALDQALAALAPDTLEAAVELAGLPEMVRGYEDIKMANVAEYRRRLTETLTRLENQHPTAAAT